MNEELKAAAGELVEALREAADLVIGDEIIPAIIKQQQAGRRVPGHEDQVWVTRLWEAIEAVDRLGRD